MRASSKLNRLTVYAQYSVRKLVNDIGGFAAVEFAMVVPIMIMMLLGSVEVSDALTVDGRIIYQMNDFGLAWTDAPLLVPAVTTRSTSGKSAAGKS